MATSEYPKYLTRKGVTRAVNNLADEVKARYDGYKVDDSGAEPTVVQNVSGGPESVERPAGNASHDEWHAYAVTQGYTEGDLEGQGRDAIRDLFAD